MSSLLVGGGGSGSGSSIGGSSGPGAMPLQPSGPFQAFFSFSWDSLPLAQLLLCGLRAETPDLAVWFALEKDGPLPDAMAKGVQESATFVVFATPKYLSSYNVRHEVTCAVQKGKRVIVLLDEEREALTLESFLTSGDSYRQIDPEKDRKEGRLHMDEKGTASFATLCRAEPHIPLYHDARILTVTLPALQSALGLAKTGPAAPLFRMRSMRPLAGHCDVLMVAATLGTLQALFLTKAIETVCGNRVMVIAGLPPHSSADAGKAAALHSSTLLVVLTTDLWADEGCTAAIRAAQSACIPIKLLWEHEKQFGGESVFDEVMKATPEALKFIYSRHQAVCNQREREFVGPMLEKLMPKLGASLVSQSLHPPPSLPVAYKPGPTNNAREEALGALQKANPPSAIYIGGLGGAGKTTVAASIASDPVLTARYDDVLWVTAGELDHAGLRRVLTKLLCELDPQNVHPKKTQPALQDEEGEDQAGPDAVDPGAGNTGPDAISKDPVTASLQRLRAVCARRSVLLIVDDIWRSRDPWSPNVAALLFGIVNVEPEDEGFPSTAIFTSRDADLFKTLAGTRPIVEVCMRDLDPSVATDYLRECALIPSGTAPLDAIFSAVGLLPLSLTLAGACMREMIESNSSLSEEGAIAEVAASLQPSPPPVMGPAKVGQWLDAAIFHDALRKVNPECTSPTAAPIYRAIQGCLCALGSKASRDFAVFGLFSYDEYVPELILSATWGLDLSATKASLKRLHNAGLVKWEEKAERAVLHDFAHDFASAIIATQPGGEGTAHALLVDRCGLALLIGGRNTAAAGEWWKCDKSEASAYFTGRLLHHLREAGRGDNATALLWKLEWLLHAVREQGGAEVAQEVGLQLKWEKDQVPMREPEVFALDLLHQTLVMASAALEGPEGAGNLAAQFIGRLGGLEGAAGTRIHTLLTDARSWNGNGNPWLRPVCPNFPPSGGPCEAVLLGHTDTVQWVCALEAGQIVSGSNDGLLRVWDSSSGVCLRVLEGHNDQIRCVCELDNGNFISSSRKGKIIMWDSNGIRVASWEGFESEIFEMAALADGRILCSSGCIFSSFSPTTLDIHSSPSTQYLFFAKRGGHLQQLIRLKDGRIVTSLGSTMRVWKSDLSNAYSIAHPAAVKLCCEIEGGLVASYSRDWTLRIWKGTVCSESFIVGIDCNAMLQVKEGQIAFAASPRDDNGNIHLWDYKKGTEVKDHVLRGHSKWVNSLCLLEDGRLVSGSHDHSVRIWNLKKNKPDLRQIAGHTALVTDVSYMGENMVLTCSGDHTLRVWDLCSGRHMYSMREQAQGVTGAVMMSDGRLASVGFSRVDFEAVKVWTAPNLGRALNGKTNGFWGIFALSPNKLLTCNKKALVVWDLTNNDKQLIINTGDVNSNYWPILVLDVNVIITCDASGEMRKWNTDTGVCDYVFRGHTGKVKALAKLGEGSFISGSEDCSVRVWDWTTGNEKEVSVLLGHEDRVASVCALPGGRIASGSKDWTVRVWDPATSKCSYQMKHGGAVVKILPIGATMLLSCSHDMVVRLWDTTRDTATGKLLSNLHLGSVYSKDSLNPVVAFTTTTGYTNLCFGLHSGAVHFVEVYNPAAPPVAAVIAEDLSVWRTYTPYVLPHLRPIQPPPAAQLPQGGGAERPPPAAQILQGGGAEMGATNPLPTGAKQDIHLAAGQVLYRSDIANPVTVYAGALRVYTFYVAADSKWVDYVVYSHELNAQEAADLGLTEKKFGWYHKELL